MIFWPSPSPPHVTGYTDLFMGQWHTRVLEMLTQSALLVSISKQQESLSPQGHLISASPGLIHRFTVTSDFSMSSLGSQDSCDF
jgi:hypothetical protein